MKKNIERAISEQLDSNLFQQNYNQIILGTKMKLTAEHTLYDFTKQSSSENVEEYLNDLYNVGKEKSLGYLPISTLKEICNTNIEIITEYAKKSNLKVLILDYPEDCNICSGAIYVYDEIMLNTLINKNALALSKAGVPNDSNENFIKYISKHLVSESEYPEAYRIIGLAYNDKRYL